MSFFKDTFLTLSVWLGSMSHQIYIYPLFTVSLTLHFLKVAVY